METLPKHRLAREEVLQTRLETIPATFPRIMDYYMMITIKLISPEGGCLRKLRSPAFCYTGLSILCILKHKLKTKQSKAKILASDQWRCHFATLKKSSLKNLLDKQQKTCFGGAHQEKH